MSFDEAAEKMPESALLAEGGIALLSAQALLIVEIALIKRAYRWHPFKRYVIGRLLEAELSSFERVSEKISKRIEESEAAATNEQRERLM